MRKVPIGSEGFFLTVSGLLGQISGVSNPNALAPLARRRWFSGLTLASPETEPSFFEVGLWFWALGALFLIALILQGPRKALGQFFAIPGHIGLIKESIQRCRTAGRLFIIVIAVSVLSWTGSQAISFGHGQAGEAIQNRAKDDLQLLLKSRGLSELALEQGAFAAIVPLRDVVSLGGNIPLLVVATIVLFRVSTERFVSHAEEFSNSPLPRLSSWATVAWIFGSLYIIYRLGCDGFGESELPMGGCLMIETILIPFGMLVCDGILLAWFLVELRDSGSGIEPREGDNWNSRPASELLPGAMLACFAAVPARYVATFGWLLAWSYLDSSVGTTPFGAWLRWLLGRGLTDIQAVALVFCGIAGAVAWTRGSLFEALSGFFALLRAEGARLVVLLGLAGLASAVCAAVIYPVVLSLPATFWLLNTADAYAHLATTAIGLATLSALVTLAERSLPEAALAEPVSFDE